MYAAPKKAKSSWIIREIFANVVEVNHARIVDRMLRAVTTGRRWFERYEASIDQCCCQ
jgi:hypothetical protein